MKDSPHDKLFKEAFGIVQNAAGEIQAALPPALLAQVDVASLTPLPGTFVDAALADSFSDLLFSARIADHDGLVYVLFEHKSGADRWVAFQLLRYMVRIWERCRQEHESEGKPLDYLPPIIPLVVHHNDSGWKVSPHFHELLAPVVHASPELARLTPQFAFLLDDFSRATDAQIRARALNAFGALALLLLRDGRTPSRLLAALPRWVDLFRQLRRAPDGARALMILFRYIFIVLDRPDWARFRQVVHASLPETEETLMSMAEELRQQGVQQGVQQGIQQGKRALLVSQVRAKFGSAPASALERIDAADQATLDRYAERILTAATLEEVFADEGAA